MATKNSIFERYLEEYLGSDKARKGAILDPKTRLRNEHKTLNPLLLKHKIDTLIARIGNIQRDYRNKK